MQYLTALVFIILMATALVAFFLAIRLFFPVRVGLARQSAEDMSARAFFLGLINAIFLSALILGLLAVSENAGAAILGILALILLVAYASALAFGLTAVVEPAGARLLPQSSANHQSIWGSMVLILGCLTPFVGWFGLFIFISLLGVGAFILSFFHRAVPIIMEEE